MADAPNPFGALINTPEVLDLRRRAEFAQQTTGMDFWAQEAGRAGLNLRRGLLEQGLAISPEDERSLQTQHIMKASQQRLAALVQSGEVTPMDAQEKVITETMAAFMKAGDYQAAQSLLPGLNQIRTYRLEQEKLRTESVENLATAGKETAAASLSNTQSVVAAARAPGQIAADTALANQRNADARLKDRTDPNIRAGGKGGAGPVMGLTNKDQEEIRANQAGVLNLFARMDDLSTIMNEAPQAASAVGGVVNTAGQYLKGVHTFLVGKGAVTSGDLSGLTEAQKAIVARNNFDNRTAMARQAASLGMNVTRYQSLVVETAYALARVNDPGGRLSNNDFDYAMKQLGAVQDPASAKAAFAAIASRAYQNVKNRMKVYNEATIDEYFRPGLNEIEEAYADFNSKWGTDGQGSGDTGIPADVQAILDRNKPKQ